MSSTNRSILMNIMRMLIHTHCTCIRHDSKMATKCFQSSASSSEIDAIAEFDDLHSLEENEKGSVHGLVGQVSPMTVGKMGKGYFHALLTDGDQDVRIVGFGKSQRNILKDFEEKGDPVALKGCRIKRSRYTTDMEPGDPSP